MSVTSLNFMGQPWQVNTTLSETFERGTSDPELLYYTTMLRRGWPEIEGLLQLSCVVTVILVCTVGRLAAFRTSHSAGLVNFA